MDVMNLIVTGQVQGVGFRWFTERQARRIGVVGWVRNLRDGSVEIWAEGSERNLEALKETVSRGPSGSYVRSVESRPARATGRYYDFSITF